MVILLSLAPSTQVVCSRSMANFRVFYTATWSEEGQCKWMQCYHAHNIILAHKKIAALRFEARACQTYAGISRCRRP